MTAKASEIFQRPLADLTDTPDEPSAADEVLQRIMRGIELVSELLQQYLVSS